MKNIFEEKNLLENKYDKVRTNLKNIENKYSYEISELTRKNAVLEEKYLQIEGKLKDDEENYKEKFEEK